MSTEPATQDVNTDDQELAKALASINQETPDADNDMAFEETPGQSGAIAGTPFGTAAPQASPDPVASVAAVVPPVAVAPTSPISAPAIGGLDTIKKDALTELRPLVDKLVLPPDEKFDTYLLLLRSTDDTSLIAPAHDAAREIPDEARRAQALLDIIKEIDYLSAHGKTA